MSFLRLIYYSAMVGGWAAFVGWFMGEVVLMHRALEPDGWMVVVTAALCGALVGGGLNFLAGIVTGSLVRSLPRLGVGLGAGFLSGALGSLFGNVLLFLIKAIAGESLSGLRFVGLLIGWTIMGACIGVVEGLYDLNWRKIRNGVLGGSVGGFLGGALFIMFFLVLSPMSGRAVALVILGMCIGLSIGLAQVVLRDAWLTVEEGFRPGRQLLLSQRQTFLGTSEKANLIFIAFGAKGVEPLHLCIVRLQDGTYEVRDNGSRTGTFVNEQPVQGSMPLRDRDVIRFGVNKVRFNERYRAAGARRVPPPAAVPATWQPAAPGPVPVANAIRSALPPPLPTTPASQVEAVRAVRPQAPATATPMPMARPTQPMAVPITMPPPAVPRPPAAPAATVPTPMPQTTPPPRLVVGRGECPICGTAATGAVGKRRCENCGGVF
jgi:hypothetical protein